MDSDYDKELYNTEIHQERAREQARRAYKAKVAQLEPVTVRDAQGNIRSMNEPEVRRWIMSEQPHVYQQWIQTLETASKVERERKQQKVQKAVAAERQELLQSVKERELRFKKNLSERDHAIKMHKTAKSAQLTRRFVRVGDEQEKLKQEKNKNQEEMLGETQKKLVEAGLRRLREDTKKQETCKNHWNEIVTVVQERKRVLSATRREKIENMVLGNEKLEARLKAKEEKRMRRAMRNQKRKERRLKKNLKLLEKERTLKHGHNEITIQNNNNDDDDDDDFDSDAESSELSSSSSSENEGGKRLSRKSSHQHETQKSHSPPSLTHHNLQSTSTTTKPHASSPPVINRLFYQSTNNQSTRREELLNKLAAHKHRIAAIEKRRQLYRSYTLAGSSRTMSLKQLTDLAAAKREQVEEKRLNQLQEIPSQLRQDYQEHAERRQAYLDRVVEATKGFRKHQQEEIERQRKIQQEADEKRREQLMSLLPSQQDKNSNQSQQQIDLSQHISATDLDELEKCDPRILDLMLGENLKKQYLKLKEERDRAVEAARIQEEERKKKDQEDWEKDAHNRHWEAKTNPTDYAVLSREQDAERKKQQHEEQQKRQAEAYAKHVQFVQDFRVRIDEETKKKEKEADQKREMIQNYRINSLQAKRENRETVRERYYDGFHAKKLEQLAPFEEVLRRPSFIMTTTNNNNQQQFPPSTTPSTSNFANFGLNNFGDTPRQVESTTITRQASQHQLTSNSAIFPSIPSSTSVGNKSINMNSNNKASPLKLDESTSSPKINNSANMMTMTKSVVIPHPPLVACSPITTHEQQQQHNIKKIPSSPPTSTPQYEKATATAEERREQVQEKQQHYKIRSAIFNRNRTMQLQMKKRRMDEKEEARNNQVDKMYQDLSQKQNEVKKNLVESLQSAEEKRRQALEEKIAKAKSYIQVHDEAKSARQFQSSNTARETREAPKFVIEKGNVKGII